MFRNLQKTPRLIMTGLLAITSAPLLYQSYIQQSQVRQDLAASAAEAAKLTWNADQIASFDFLGSISTAEMFSATPASTFASMGIGVAALLLATIIAAGAAMK